ncbi:MAG: thiamine pyrophosphate-dependent enzyme [Gaiellaceae bacterium]
MGLTVRDAAFDVFRRLDLTTLFSNPGSTEVPFLTGLPEDLRFVLGLHEGAVVGLASGYALARRRPSLVLLHTTAGLGNAVSSIATCRVNRTPVVILVGQQDRRHLAFEPFLAGKLQGLAGEYPVWVDQPPRAQAVPGSIERAFHEAKTHRGPALVIVPMGDWLEAAGEPHEAAAPRRVLRPPAVDDAAVAALAELVERAQRPALVAGARMDTAERWAALVALAERLGCAVYQEAFSGQAGFPQDHPQWAGLLPFDRPRLRETLAPYDLVLAFGAPVFRQNPFHEGPFTHGDATLVVVTDEPDEVHRSSVELAVLASPGDLARRLAEVVPQRARPDAPLVRPPAPPLKAAHVLQALGDRLEPDTALFEECPSNQVELTLRIPARRPLGFVSAAMGGLGWALSASAGARLGLPERPVVAVLGDGSTTFGVHGLWSAARYGAGVLYVVLKNGGYRIMDQLAARQGGAPPWPSFDVDLAAIARGLGCEARAIADEAGLAAVLDEVVPGLRERPSPLLLEITVEPG